MQKYGKKGKPQNVRRSFYLLLKIED